jgi:hypothetical protein
MTRVYGAIPFATFIRCLARRFQLPQDGRTRCCPTRIRTSATRYRMSPMTKTTIIAALALAALTGAAQAQSVDHVSTCGGILHRDGARLFVGDPKTETAEDLPCFVVQSEVKKVLWVCALGRWCEIAGVVAPDCEPGKCEMTKVTSIGRKMKR